LTAYNSTRSKRIIEELSMMHFFLNIVSLELKLGVAIALFEAT
jgi:hypothetical protein